MVSIMQLALVALNTPRSPLLSLIGSYSLVCPLVPEHKSFRRLLIERDSKTCAPVQYTRGNEELGNLTDSGSNDLSSRPPSELQFGKLCIITPMTLPTLRLQWKYSPER